MIIFLPKNQAFLRKHLFAMRCVLKGQKRPLRRKREVRVLLQQLEVSASQQRQSQAKLKPIYRQSQEKTIFQQPARASSSVQLSLQAEEKLKAEIAPERPILTSPKKSFVPFKLSSRLAKILFVGLTVLSLTLITVLFGPALYYKVFPGDPVPLSTTETGTPLGGRFDEGAAATQERRIPLPPYDETLPEGQWLIIPRIGVRTEIQENQNSEAALEKGVWRVPDFGIAGDLNKPMILAAHRYGYIWWWKNDSQYWRYHSFYLLPTVQQGDLVEVIYEKRKYVYEIYAGEEGTEISDYNADLILYTCKFLTGETRFFRYARLLDTSKDTQATAN